MNERVEQITESWSSYEEVGPGIYRYADVVPESLDIINRLEKVLKGKNGYNWLQAKVGYNEIVKDYRDCVDFKYKKTDLYDDGSEDYQELVKIWQQIFDRNIAAVDHYRSIFKIGDLRYWEAMNFVRYGEGQHFMEHHDHGFSYNCTVSLVTYLNDNYEGGELGFTLQGLKLKPKAGDTFIFPSNYMYPHIAHKVTSGLKYSVVTMLDYNEKFHTNEIYKDLKKINT